MEKEGMLADPIERGPNAPAIGPVSDARKDGSQWVTRDHLAAPAGEQIDVTVIGVLDLRGEIRQVHDLAEELALQRPRKRCPIDLVVSDEVFAEEDAETARAGDGRLDLSRVERAILHEHLAEER